MENKTITENNVATKTCPYCGSQVPQFAKKCGNCGEWIVKREGNSWVKTLLLCGFLGMFGAHNFYNKKTGTATAQLILGISVIGLIISVPWAVIEEFIILCGGYRDYQGLELSKKPTVKSTALLCFFVGLSGVHRFYTGHIGTAWLQLLTAGGLGIWTLVDFIMILTKRFKDANGLIIE